MRISMAARDFGLRVGKGELMSRRRTNSAFEDLTELVAMLPWWLGVGTAIAAYVMLGAFAEPAHTPDGLRPNQVVVRLFATTGQYFVPFVCLLGAALSAWRRAQRRKLARDATENRAANALHGISWREFEMLVGEAFRMKGFRVLETGGGGPDGGVDLVLRKGGETFLVQCKQWKAFKVGVDVVRQLYGVMAARGATGGFVVTSGRFTDEARSFSDGRNVTLVDGSRLAAMLESARAAKEGAGGRPAQIDRATSATATPACPSCGSPMMRRTARRGPNAGSAFWGCSTYPVCRCTRPVGPDEPKLEGVPTV